MKRNLHLFFVLLVSCVSTSLYAQLPNGSIAPDFTLTDLNGVTYNLYDELDAGKSVILDISATWCPPCWTYHTSGVLEELYEDYGPDGTDEIRVFMVEGDDITNLACLYGSAGCNNTTMGDWVTGTQYPIFSPEPAEADAFIADYQLGFWPTIYGISPLDKTTQLVGQASYEVWEGWLIDSWQMSALTTSFDSDCPYEGMVDLEMTNGFGTLDFEWSDGSTNEDLMDVPAGTYSVTITDDHNVSITVDNIVVGGTDAPALAVAEVDNEAVDCNGNSTGALQVIASGGDGGFSYSWSNGLSGSFIDNLSAGDYEVTCTDLNGCTVMQSYTVSEPDVLTMGSSVTGTECGEENGFAFLFGEGGTTPYLYDIGFGGQLNGSFPSLAAGDYTAKITDGNGCITEMPFTVEASVAPQAVAEAASAISCTETEVLVSSSNSTFTGNVDYLWSTDDGTIVGDAEAESIMASAAGTYELRIIETSTGCISETSVIVEDETSLPMLTIADVDELNCSITEVLIDGSQSESGDNLVYSWTTDDGNIIGDTDGNMINVDLGGTYTLSITNTENGCISSESVEVMADTEAPSIEVTSEVLTCAVSEVEICATVADGHSVVWTTGAGDISESCITVSAAGEYMATVSAPNGCTSSAISMVTASTDLPEVSIATPEVLTCTQETVQISADIVDAMADDIITWTNADGDVVSEGSSEIMVSDPGVYDISVTNALGCTTVASVEVEENINTPVASFDYSVDTDGVVTLNSTSNDGGIVSWTLEDGTVLTGEDVTFSLSMGGEYEVCMTYANECGSDEKCETVVYSTALAVSIDKSNLTCFDSNNGSASAIVTGGASGYTYYWTGPNGFESGDSQIANLPAGTYTLVVTDQDQTQVTSEVTLTQPEELRAMNENVLDASCNGEFDGSIDFTMMGGTAPYQYSWSDGSTEGNRSDLAAGDYTLNVIDGNNCEFVKTFIIAEPDAISITSIVTTEDEDGLSNGSISLEVGGGSGDYMYEWSNGATTANIDNLAAGEYSVIITDSNGCSFTQNGIIVDTVTDVEDLKVVTEFSMYPVPAYNVLNVNAKLNSTQKVNVNILDATGKLVWSRLYQTNEISEKVDLTSFAPGIYTLAMVSSDAIESQSFIVIK